MSAGTPDAWVLRGTIVLDGESGYAILEHAANSGQQWRHTGAELIPGMHLVSVAPDHAVIEHEGRRRQLSFGARLGATASIPATSNFRIDPLRIPEIAAAVDIIPHRQNGRVVGFYANNIPEALRGEIGLQPGDLLHLINGIPLDAHVDAARFYQLLQTGQINIEVVREGSPIQLVYQLR